MPCKDYDTPSYGEQGSAETQKKLDMLSRIACKALYIVEEMHKYRDLQPEHITAINDVLNDKEVKTWWTKHKAADVAAANLAAKENKLLEAERIAARDKLAREALLKKLSPEDRRLLNLK